MQEQDEKSNSILICRRIKNKSKVTIDKDRDDCNVREIPIHHTKIYFYKNKKAKAENNELSNITGGKIRVSLD